MANKRLSKEKQALVLAALCEGTPIEAVARMFKIGTNTITRVIRETGEAFADYMDKEFRDLPCRRIEMDEQWQYVGCHAGRMPKPKNLWQKRDKDARRLLALGVHRRGHEAGFFAQDRKARLLDGQQFVEDVRDRVNGPVQIATDNLPSYPCSHSRGISDTKVLAYGTETKVFGEPATA